jgi:hypothetical protein
MVLVRGLLLVALVLSSLGAGWAIPVQFKIDEMLKKADQPKAVYPPARAGWNGAEEPQSARISPNPTYEKLIQGSSPVAVRAQLLRAAFPHWSIVAIIPMLIFALRMLRKSLTLAGPQQRQDNLFLMASRRGIPDNSVPSQEAA